MNLPNGHSLISVAPMMQITNSYFRALCRILAKDVTLYTEMLVDRSILSMPNDRLLKNIGIVPDLNTVIQIGSSDEKLAAQSVKRIMEMSEGKWNKFNLNVGCPSSKVKGANFGAVLMLQPEKVKDICQSILDENPDCSLTVKCRIGVDDKDSYEDFYGFINTVSKTIDHFIVHSRKALLCGISTKQNLTVPPLNYEFIKQIVKDFPNKYFTLNGGVSGSANDIKSTFLPIFGSVMLGRSISENPWLLFELSKGMTKAGLSKRIAVLQEYSVCLKQFHDSMDVSAKFSLLPLNNLFAGKSLSKRYRKHLHESTDKHRNDPSNVINEVIEKLQAIQAALYRNKDILGINLADLQLE